MPFVDRDEIRLYFEDTGEGPPIVLGHSFLCTGEMWAWQARELSSSYRVINLDLRGHGNSGPAEWRFGFADLVDDVVTVLDHLDIERAVWCGLSIGGMTALHASLSVPDRMSAMIVADAAAGPDPGLVRAKYRLMAILARIFGVRSMLGRVNPIMFGETTLREQPELVAEWGERFAAMHMPSLLNTLAALQGRADLHERLGSVRMPTLVLVGEEDRGQPPPRSRRIAGAIPGAELVVIPEAGHLSSLEQPEAVTETIREFLAGALPGQGR